MRRGSAVGGKADGSPRAPGAGAKRTTIGRGDSGAIATRAASGARVRGVSPARAAATTPLWSCPHGDGRAPTREPGASAWWHSGEDRATDAPRSASHDASQRSSSTGSAAIAAATTAAAAPRQETIIRRDPSSLRVLLRVLIELRFAHLRAEVVRLAVVLALARRLFFVDLHLAHGIGHHGLPPLNFELIAHSTAERGEVSTRCR